MILQESTDSEEEPEKPRFLTMEEARYQLQMKRPEMETVRRQSERPENFDTFPS